MSEKMLVTQALDERDLLVKKIGDKIAKANFVDTIRPRIRFTPGGLRKRSLPKRRRRPISRSRI